ncbi:MAG: MoxR family ATPase, partial [Jatrophihabitantaceae bacterium]
GLVLADEINRTPPKTQAALLEAMQEGQATVEGRTFDLPRPFHVIATANPIEYEGTYPLPEAQLDRFLLRVSFGYPSPEEEWQVLQRRVARRAEQINLNPILDPAGLLALQRVVENIEVEETVGRYCVALVDATRFHQHLLVGSSPRGALALLLVARAYALINHRDYVTPDDVKAVAIAALAHRVTLRPEMWMRNLSPADVIDSVLSSVAAPASAANRPSYSAAGRP